MLASGEMGLETDTFQAKAGDGVTAWNSLPYNFNGPPGPQGDPGSVWYDGDGAPGAGLGVDGDYYLDNLTGDYYTKIAGAWVLQGNLTGPPGPQGPTGEVPEAPNDGVPYVRKSAAWTAGPESSDSSTLDIQSVTQAEYDGLTPVATTLYLITG